jgi:16S rRNA (uracil1498-N3)-methyltransferase
VSSTPPRFQISSTAIHAGLARIRGPEAHHLRDVMRMRAGALVSLIDERGRNLEARIVLVDSKGVVVRIERVAEPGAQPPLILALAIIKGARMDFAIEKAVELGATEIWPLICARCVARDPGRERIARWRRLAIAAGKQSLAAHRVEVRAPLSFDEMLTQVPDAMRPVICQAEGLPFHWVAKQATRKGILIACGPEGDFTPEELAAAERAGFMRATLGINRLRTETAALAALALAASVLVELVTQPD